MLSREALEERRCGGAGDEHEDVVGRGVHVRDPPGLDGEAVAFGSENDGVTCGHVWVVECESLVSVVDVEDPVGPGADVEHEDVVHAEEEVSEAWVTATVLQSKWIVNGDVSTERSAGIHAGCR